MNSISPPRIFARRVPAVGDVFGDLTVTAVPETLRVSRDEWTCSCKCGATGVRLRGNVLLQGQISCGCAIGRGKPKIPLLGEIFNRLVVSGVPVKQRVSKDKWTCRCVCGNLNELLVLGEHLVHGQVKSCGCLDKENKAARAEYYRRRKLAARSWKTMLRSVQFGGAAVDARWQDFECFFMDLGERPHGTVLSRHDLSGPFTPVNCFWEDRRAQIERVRRKSPALVDLEVTDGSTKRCTKCLVEKPLIEFSASHRGTEAVIQSRCKTCYAAYAKERNRRDIGKRLVQAAKSRAIKSGIDFNLTVEDISPLPTHCPVFGIELKISSIDDRDASYTLDRLDNDRGYVRDNVVVISWLANRLKNDGTAAQHARIAQWMREREETSRLSDAADISTAQIGIAEIEGDA